MADTFTATALKGKTLHTPKGFIIFNAGKETRFIPEEHRDALVKEGIIAGEGGGDESAAAPKAPAGKAPARKPAGRKAAASGAGDDFEAGAFTVTKTEGIGMYAISGPGLDAPESVKGRAKVQSRLDELNKAAASGAKSDAPTE